MEKISDLSLCKKYLALAKSAQDRNKDFDLSLAKLRRLMNQKKCYYTGTVFSDGQEARTIDRINNNEGYVDSNLVACTQKINLLKSTLSVEELESLVKKLKRLSK